MSTMFGGAGFSSAATSAAVSSRAATERRYCFIGGSLLLRGRDQQRGLRRAAPAQVVLRVGVAVEELVKLLVQPLLRGGVLRPVDQVRSLPRIVLQIVQLVRPLRKAVDVLPLVRADGAGVLE